MTERKRCAAVIEGPLAETHSRPPRPWWRRNCKRLAVPGSKYCWQHDQIERRYGYKGTPDDLP